LSRSLENRSSMQCNQVRWRLRSERYGASGRYVTSFRQMGRIFNARTGVLRLKLYGNEEERRRPGLVYRGCFTMGTIATELRIPKNDAARSHHACTSEVGFVQSARVENLNIETATSNPFLPTDRKWAIRFNPGGTVTIVLGMRDYGRGWFSAYFAGLVTARLGIPFRRVRVYYSATLPAVLQTPVPSPIVLSRSHIGPVASAVANIIEGMCDQVIEKGRLVFAAMAGVGAIDVGFDQPTGRFFVLDRDRSGSLLEIAETTRGGSSVSAEIRKETSARAQALDRGRDPGTDGGVIQPAAG
jgi:CO/xanthine dehydrogenase Mo-binding subunit